MKVSRRPVNPSRRVSENEAAPFSSPTHPRSRSPPYLSIALIILGAFLLIGYLHLGQGAFGNKLALSWVQGDISCNAEVQRAIPILKAAYGDSSRRVLHVGPDACSTVSRLLSEEETDARGVEPYDIEDADRRCKRLVHRGIVRVADIRFLLPYRAKSFSLVIVSDALDYLSPKYLNRTVPELARVSSDGLVIFTGYPHNVRAKSADKGKYGRSVKLRSASWWGQYFDHLSLEENEDAIKKFEQAAKRMSYISQCQVFHLKPYN
ncbi:transmembrane protein [Perilla frutescens var. hirtella]|nr:transmembrane protein [Perilla frutescens var. frutescens]KAH6776362.1 transmembrane protein [Perilla frutescens var. hirtella]